MIVSVSIFSPLGGHEAEPTEIKIKDSLPEFSSLEEAGEFYQAQAEAIVSGLCSSLPQGTLHRLLIELLKRSPVLFRGKAGT
jgi:hypothetical protein